MILTVAAAIALAGQCAPDVDPTLIVSIAVRESSLNTEARHENAPGRGTDYGLMGINSRNFGWLGLTVQTAMDPCLSMRAGAAVLRGLSSYNTGSPTRGIANGYAPAVLTTAATVRGAPAEAPAPVPAHRLHLRDQIASFEK